MVSKTEIALNPGAEFIHFFKLKGTNKYPNFYSGFTYKKGAQALIIRQMGIITHGNATGESTLVGYSSTRLDHHMQLITKGYVDYNPNFVMVNRTAATTISAPATGPITATDDGVFVNDELVVKADFQ